MIYFAVAILLLLLPALIVAVNSHHHKRLRFTRPVISTLATVETPLSPQGSVLIDGELWMARAVNDAAVPARTKVRVVDIQNHLLVVERVGSVN